jgi:alginate O-acetyltransferase complex protein AlgI
MELNSPTFLFIYLPIFFVLYAICGKRYRNHLLILSSLIFFIWGDPLYFPISFILVLLDWLFLQGIQMNGSIPSRQKRLQATGIVINLLCLLFFKALASYGQSLAALAQHSVLAVPTWLTNNLPRIAHLPLGLSFLTFQAISLLLDAPYDSDEKSLFQPVALHLLMFPKAISGPLVRFGRIRSQTQEREFTPSRIAAGLRRFMLGFAKKALIADQLALVTDGGIFTQAPQRIPTGVAWIVIICYTLQIYFDFSAYTDMAIGLGQVLGFKLPENFNDPYWSVSITDFWRRWHMTLSGWFRDYVFYPLETKRASSGRHTQSLNILIVSC